MNILKRNSTTINIATFWENFQLSKYNFEPPYQRPSEVWSESKKSFLIDTILKNFPMPPIFLHQHIESSSGKTMYDIIDGKQRLGAIISFIRNDIRTPDDFNSDNFGDDNLAGIYFRELESESISDWKKTFWRYEITIEYIDTDQLDVVNNIFDRLNRNGEPLTRQELRNAKYHASSFYKHIKELSKLSEFAIIFDKIQKNRLEHEEFVSELLLSLINDDVITGDNPDNLDAEYEKYSINTEYEYKLDKLNNDFILITKLLFNLKIDFEKYKIQGLSHFYGLWMMSMTLYKKDFNITDNFSIVLNDFYEKYKQNDLDKNIVTYKTTMSAGTKSKARRTRRINALLEYCKTGLQI